METVDRELIQGSHSAVLQEVMKMQNEGIEIKNDVFWQAGKDGDGQPNPS